MSDVPAETLYCANHPQTPTQLRCNKCGKPICTRCIVRTPVGYRCRECMRQQQQVFDTALWYDYVVAGVIAAPLAGLAGILSLYVGFLILFLGPLAGGLIAEVVRWAVRRRRSRYLSLTAAAAFVLGCLPLVVIPLFGGALFAAVWPLVYCLMGAGTVYARLRGISV